LTTEVFSGRGKMPSLYLKCKSCGVTFSSKMSMDTEKFKKEIMKYNTHKCPKGHVNTYNKEDYFFQQALSELLTT